MPTVIDSLIVTLGLDPKGFTEGQRQMAANLRQMETGAQRAAQNIERSGSGIVSFFRTIDHPIASIRQHFERLATVTATPQRNLANLAQQGLRTGQEVERGALAGAAGLRVMGAAGLTAIAAFMTLDKWRNDATKRADERFGVGVGAAGANLPIGDYSAISQALYRTGLVPEAETQEWLGSVRSAQIQAQRGSVEAANSLAVLLSKMNVTGDLSDVNVYKDSNTQILRAVAQQFHDVSEDAAIGLGKMAGWSKEFSLDLHNLGAAGFDAAVAGAQHTAETKEELEAQRELALANARLDTSWQKLTWRIDAEVDPALSRFDDWLASLLDTLSGVDPGAFALKNSAPNSPADAKPGFWRSVAEWLGFAVPIGDTSSLPSGSTSPGGAGVGPSEGMAATASAAARGGALLALGISPGSPEWQIAMRESRGNPNIGWAGLPGSADYSPGGTDLSNYPLDSTGFPMWMGKMGPAGNSTAAGLFMITGTNWHKYAPALGIHDFSSESQYRVQQAMVAANRGYGDWAASGTTNFPITDAGISAAHLRSIQSTQAGGSSTTHTTTNDVDINGGVHVYGTNTSGGYQTGGAIADALHSQLLTAQINSGQE